MGNHVFYDFKTKNVTFIKVYLQLKEMGIQNNKFHLRLNNPELQGVDPYSPDLTDLQKKAIVRECQDNICYYLREVVRIPAMGGGTHWFHLDLGGISALYLFMNNINFYLMKPRFCHKTTDVECILSYPFLFYPNNKIELSAHKQDQARRNLRRIKDIVTTLPDYIVEGFISSTKGNIDSTINNVRNSSIKVRPYARSEGEAGEIGQECVGNYRHYDEMEFTKYIDTLIKSSLMTFNRVSVHNEDHCMIFTSVPGKLEDDSCRRALEMTDDFVPWCTEMLDSEGEELKEYIECYSEHSDIWKCMYVKYEYTDLGLDSDWYEHMCLSLNNDKDIIKREILLKHV